MSDTLLQLTQAIARTLAGFAAPLPKMACTLQHLRISAANAKRREGCTAAHAYAPLVSRAARNGLHERAKDVAAALLALDEPLPWTYHYPPRSSAEDLAERIAFAELIGPDGPLYSPGCRVGFTVMAEHTLYPLHLHPAAELYLVIAGHARWSTPSSERTVPPGDLVLHRPNEPHSMQTTQEPLLALWGWSGDIDEPAVYL